MPHSRRSRTVLRGASARAVRAFRRSDHRFGGWFRGRAARGCAAISHSYLSRYGPRRIREDVIVTTPIRAALGDIRVLKDTGEAAQSFRDFSAAGAPVHAGVLVMQPVEIGIDGDFDVNDQCALDPTTYAFEDRRRVDGARLLFVPWPSVRNAG